LMRDEESSEGKESVAAVDVPGVRRASARTRAGSRGFGQLMMREMGKKRLCKVMNRRRR
jgi:hypothetical protein